MKLRRCNLEGHYRNYAKNRDSGLLNKMPLYLFALLKNELLNSVYLLSTSTYKLYPINCTHMAKKEQHGGREKKKPKKVVVK
jgi:hypothetical protein